MMGKDLVIMDDYYDRQRREAIGPNPYDPSNPQYRHMEADLATLQDTSTSLGKGPWYAPLLPFLILVGAAIVAIIQGP
jgi:hypothetical protein